MRLSSTSSSLILATLAVSSSSVALAAPTEPGALDEAMPHSASDLQIIAMAGRSEQAVSGLDPTPMSDSDPIAAAMVQDMLARRGLLDTLGGLLSGLPVVGPILAPLLKTLSSLANGLGLSLDAVQNNAVDGQSTPALTPDQIRMVANAISVAHDHMQVVMAQQNGLHARGQIVEWDAVSDPPSASSSGSSAASATPSSASTSANSTSSGSATSSSGSATPTGLPAPNGLPANPPNTPSVPAAAPPAPKAPAVPGLLKLASRMISPVFIKAGQNKLEVSMSGGPATIFTGNSSSPTTTATSSGDVTTFASTTTANATSTAGP